MKEHKHNSNLKFMILCFFFAAIFGVLYQQGYIFVFLSLLFIVLATVFAFAFFASKILRKNAAYCIIVIAEVIILLCCTAYFISDILTDDGLLPGIGGAVGLMVVDPIIIIALIITILVYKHTIDK